MTRRLSLRRAGRIAAGLVEQFSPACHRIEIAGSIRRSRPRVKDIELVAIPKTRAEGQAGLFGESPRVTRNLLHGKITELSEGLSRLRPIKPGTPEPTGVDSWKWDDLWPAKETRPSSYWRIWIPRHEIRFDLFLATPETWGSKFTLRTGSADFSAGLVRYWTRHSRGGHFHEGRVHPPIGSGEAPAAKKRLRDGTIALLGEPLETPEEADVFRALGVRWVAPGERVSGSQIVKA